AEIKKIISEAEENAESDAQHKKVAEARVELEGLLFTTEKSINEFQDELPSEMAEKVIAALTTAKKALEANELTAIEEAKAELNEAAHSMAEHIYGQIAESAE